MAPTVRGCRRHDRTAVVYAKPSAWCVVTLSGGPGFGAAGKTHLNRDTGRVYKKVGKTEVPTPATGPYAPHPERAHREARWVTDRAGTVVPLITDTPARPGDVFDATVDPVDPADYRETVATVSADGETAINVAAYVGLLRDLGVDGDYPGFVVDEVPGREPAAAIAGGTPLSVLAQVTFHRADVTTHSAGGAGRGDLDAALAAGVQTRLPEWSWRESERPFGVDSDDLVE